MGAFLNFWGGKYQKGSNRYRTCDLPFTTPTTQPSPPLGLFRLYLLLYSSYRLSTLLKKIVTKSKYLLYKVKPVSTTLNLATLIETQAVITLFPFCLSEDLSQ
jgi:hypothetical protein